MHKLLSLALLAPLLLAAQGCDVATPAVQAAPADAAADALAKAAEIQPFHLRDDMAVAVDDRGNVMLQVQGAEIRLSAVEMLALTEVAGSAAVQQLDDERFAVIFPNDPPRPKGGPNCIPDPDGTSFVASAFAGTGCPKPPVGDLGPREMRFVYGDHFDLDETPRGEPMPAAGGWVYKRR